MAVEGVQEAAQNVTPSCRHVVGWHEPERQQSQENAPVPDQVGVEHEDVLGLHDGLQVKRSCIFAMSRSRLFLNYRLELERLLLLLDGYLGLRSTIKVGVMFHVRSLANLRISFAMS